MSCRADANYSDRSCHYLIKLVRMERFELSAACSQSKRSTRLSHTLIEINLQTGYSWPVHLPYLRQTCLQVQHGLPLTMDSIVMKSTVILKLICSNKIYHASLFTNQLPNRLRSSGHIVSTSIEDHHSVDDSSNVSYPRQFYCKIGQVWRTRTFEHSAPNGEQ